MAHRAKADAVAMEDEMEAANAAKAEEAKKRASAEASARSRERSGIVTPGERRDASTSASGAQGPGATPARTPRRMGL